MFQKKKIEQSKPTIDEQLQMKKILKNVDTDKQQQHSKLMDEFRKAHRKMFKATDDAEASDETNSDHSVVSKISSDAFFA